MSKLRLQWKKFADYYIETGNAYESCLKAGYALGTAKSRSSDLLKRPEIQEYISERMKELDSLKIMNQKEMLELLTSIARGEMKEEVLIGDGQGHQKTIDINVSTKDKIKAVELLGKRYGMWTDKVDMTGNIELIFEDDYGDEDD